MHYTDLRPHERCQIQCLHAGGLSSREIAKVLERSDTTVGRAPVKLVSRLRHG